jgi:hypothetical protein
MWFDPEKPYNDLPLLPPKAELEKKAVLRKAIAANEALAELKGAGDFDSEPEHVDQREVCVKRSCRPGLEPAELGTKSLL